MGAPRRDPYAILGMPRAASRNEIAAAYRRLAKAHHPDLKPGDKEAAARFQAIQAAYEVLRKAEERRGVTG